MKYKHLERIKVELNVLSPVHIGCGEKMRKKEQIYDEARGVLHVPAMPEMLEYIRYNCPKGTLEQYERFLQQDTTEDLGAFLKRKNIRLTPPPRWIHRSIRVAGSVRRVNELNLFIHNTQEEAYIPGSSIKGALRTALLAHYMDREKSKRDFKRWKDKDSIALESILRRLKADDNNSNDAVYDLLRGMEITDTAAFAREDMIVCQRSGMCTDSADRKQISTFSECLRPKAKTHFYVTLDYNILPEDFLRTVKESLMEWNDIQYKAYDRFFEDNGIELADVTCRKGAVPLTLGSGTGFQTHSTVYAAFGDSNDGLVIAEDILMSQFSKTYKPRSDAKAAPYQKKITQFNNLDYPMGRCELVF